jgi:hypothetical protein
MSERNDFNLKKYNIKTEHQWHGVVPQYPLNVKVCEKLRLNF